MAKKWVLCMRGPLPTKTFLRLQWREKRCKGSPGTTCAGPSAFVIRTCLVAGGEPRTLVKGSERIKTKHTCFGPIYLDPFLVEEKTESREKSQKAKFDHAA